ncbi:MAG: TolC family protein [Bacteroidales bacterium]|nr:TolC family protein [Bacteroidales bacterium]
MKIRKYFKIAAAILAMTVIAPSAAMAQVYTLDSCRSMALVNNKQLMMTRQRMQKADYQHREAFAAYLPAFDFAGGYMYNQKKISIFGSDQYLPVGTFNQEALVNPDAQKYNFGVVKNPMTGEPVIVNGQPVPEQVALIPKKAMEYDIHNVFFGAVTLTQPIYMGGKIVAMNKLTGYAKELSAALHNNEAENVIYAVDAAYWQVVSLKAKYDLAVSYVNLLDSLDHNVSLMFEEGVATRADKLSVDVKLNSAKVDLAKVENGLTLSRMALAQVCGLPINSDMHLADEPGGERLEIASDIDAGIISASDIDAAFSRRQDLKALELGIDIAGQQKKVAMSEMLPNVALIGAYSFSNPNMFDGFSKKFAGAFSIGAMVKIPLWHWGGNYYKYKAAESDETIMRLQLEDAREMATLQINQASFKARESLKTYRTTQSNLASADENLRCATIGFKEGVTTTDDVMAAQTAWLKANSENIDAMIEVQLCDTYLSKVLGTLMY